MSVKQEKSYRVLSVTMPGPLLGELDSYCFLHGKVPRSHVIATAVRRYLNSRGEQA